MSTRPDAVPTALLAAVVAGLLLVAACFSEHASLAGPDGETLCGATPGPNIVQIRDYAFHPAQLQVSAGTRVTWVNCDPDLHTSTSDGGAWDSDLLSESASFARTFDAAGSFAYHCEPHPFMRGVVAVTTP